jgi:pimeloyl-ACP methyl ester carboxylesterase
MQANASDYCRLYAVNDKNVKDSEFFTISEAFKVKALGDKYSGYDIEALDVHPFSKELYVASSDKSTEPGHLYTVHKLTGELEKIGDTGFADIEGLSFKPDGTLWGWAKMDGLIKINPETAESKLVLANDAEVEDLTWNNDGSQIYAVEDTNLWVSDGRSAELACSNLPGHTEAIEMLPDGNILLGIHGNKGVTRFQSLNPVTCEQVIDTTIPTEDYNDIEGIAWACQPQVYLLLHGMNSDEKTWNKLIDSKFNGMCGTIENGEWTMTDKNHSALDPSDYECYRIRFGTSEHGNVGLEGDFFWEKGDGSTFEQLGKEVNKAIEEIVRPFSKNATVVTLVAHSRGGLAARAFLQNPEYPLRSEINGLLTIGTPHQGSPFGRIYQWLEDNPRPEKKCQKTECVTTSPYTLPQCYEVLDYCSEVEQKRGKIWYATDLLRNLIDLRKPTIGFLADNSTEIDHLNANVQQLNKNIVYAEMVSINVPVFSDLKKIGVDIGVDVVYDGDGIVPVYSQRMSLIPNFPTEVIQLLPLKYVLHIDETKQVSEIEAALRAMQAGIFVE